MLIIVRPLSGIACDGSGTGLVGGAIGTPQLLQNLLARMFGAPHEGQDV